MTSEPCIMLVEDRSRPDIADAQILAAVAELEKANAIYERFAVPCPLQMASAIRYAVRAMDFFPARRRFDGYVALGAVAGDQAVRDRAILRQTLAGLDMLALDHTLAIGGAVTVIGVSDARRDAANAAITCLRMIELKRRFRLFPRLD